MAQSGSGWLLSSRRKQVAITPGFRETTSWLTVSKSRNGMSQASTNQAAPGCFRNAERIPPIGPISPQESTVAGYRDLSPFFTWSARVEIRISVQCGRSSEKRKSKCGCPPYRRSTLSCPMRRLFPPVRIKPLSCGGRLLLFPPASPVAVLRESVIKLACPFPLAGRQTPLRVPSRLLFGSKT